MNHCTQPQGIHFQQQKTKDQRFFIFLDGRSALGLGLEPPLVKPSADCGSALSETPPSSLIAFAKAR
jgi:hypothetical protein